MTVRSIRITIQGEEATVWIRGPYEGALRICKVGLAVGSQGSTAAVLRAFLEDANTIHAAGTGAVSQFSLPEAAILD
jgi:hypothetical protein